MCVCDNTSLQARILQAFLRQHSCCWSALGKECGKAAFYSCRPEFICSLQANFQQEELLKPVMSGASCQLPGLEWMLGQIWPLRALAAIPYR